MVRQFLLFAAVAFPAFSSASSITDLSQWTLIEDPAHAGMTSPSQSATEARLRAAGSVPSGTDIGYASINGPDVAGSTAGYYFDPSSDFTIAIDFDVSARSVTGGGGIGFGIGEDVGGANSAGAGVLLVDGSAAVIGTAARVGDVDEPFEIISLPGFSVGRFFVEYVSATQEVILGVHPTPGAANPSATQTFSNVANQWTGAPLVASFFLRSQQVVLPPLIDVPAQTIGQTDATFSNFEVLAGTAIRVPEPGTALLLGTTLLVSGRSPRHARGVC